jgi:hypothetical protein
MPDEIAKKTGTTQHAGPHILWKLSHPPRKTSQMELGQCGRKLSNRPVAIGARALRG